MSPAKHPASAKEDEPMSAADRDHWTLDKKVPLAIIIAILAQFAGVVWMASRFNAENMETKRDIARIEATLKAVVDRIDRVDTARTAGEMRIVRVEEQVRQIYETVKRIDEKLERDAGQRRP